MSAFNSHYYPYLFYCSTPSIFLSSVKPLISATVSIQPSLAGYSAYLCLEQDMNIADSYAYQQ